MTTAAIRPRLNWWKLLPVGALRCPVDDAALHWEVMGGMRVRRGSIYQAQCPKCKKNYDVLAPKTNE